MAFYLTQSTESSDSPVEVWRDKLSSSATLVFTRTVSDVNLVALDDLTSASDLSKVVGHDVSMAARLLRIAGSALFNRQGRTVNTINAAIVRIGFDSIRELAASLALIEQVLNGQPHDKVTQTMSRAFHAATQAKSLAALSGNDRLEEVFAAALLLELGAMLFWAQASEEAEVLEALLATGAPDTEAEKQALGFLLLDLSAALAEEWQLGELLNVALNPEKFQSPKQTEAQATQVRCVLWAHELARTAEQLGWESKEFRGLLKRIAAELEVNEAALDEQVQENFRETADIANRYGVPHIAKAIKASVAPVSATPSGQRTTNLAPARPPSSQSQIEILQEIGDALNEGRSLNDLVALVLKGIFEGLGFDRTYFALLSQDRTEMQCRYALGSTPPEFLNASRSFASEGDMFAEALKSGLPKLLSPQALALEPDNLGWLSYTECAVMPIVVQGKAIGVLYADKAASESSLDDPAYRGFQLFGQQLATILLTIRNGAAKTG